MEISWNEQVDGSLMMRYFNSVGDFIVYVKRARFGRWRWDAYTDVGGKRLGGSWAGGHLSRDAARIPAEKWIADKVEEMRFLGEEVWPGEAFVT